MSRPRPSMHDREVVQRHMVAIRDRVRQYLIGRGDPAPDMADAMHDVEFAMGTNLDGYAVAKDLEDRHWLADIDLANVMNSLLHERWTVYHEAVEEWVKAERITPTLGKGERVTCTPPGGRGLAFEGEILDVDRKRATYLVCVPARGHTRDGTRGGTHVPFEDADVNFR